MYTKCRLSKLTAERLRWGPSDRITSSVRSDWSESQTKPMVTISGEFMRTRLILILWPQLLYKRKTQEKTTVLPRSNITTYQVHSKNCKSVKINIKISENHNTPKETLFNRKKKNGENYELNCWWKASARHWSICYTLLFQGREQCAY